MQARRMNIVDSSLSAVPAIGTWLWALHDTRQRTMEELESVGAEMVDWTHPEHSSTIGSILYHLALIETDWLYVEVLEQPFPDDIIALFPQADRDAQGKLSHVTQVTLSEHLARLTTIREKLLAAYQQMDLAEFRRVRSFEHYDVTPEWVLHHLIQHEAEHRNQIAAIRDAAKRHLRGLGSGVGEQQNH